MSAQRAPGDFAERYGRFALVAGGSDGIGAAFADEIARRGLDLVLAARDPDKLSARAAELRKSYGVEVRTVSVDLAAPDAVEQIVKATADLDVGLLVNNAGASPSSDRFLDRDAAAALYMVDLNCRGPVRLAHHFATRFRNRGRGGIVLMSSLACLAGSSYQTAYCAAKAFVTTLAEGLWHELSPEGVDVLGVLAGSTRTESVLHQSAEFENAMAPEEVASGALEALGTGPIFVPGESNRAMARAMWPVPRVGLINAMSQACAQLFGLPHAAVEGEEFSSD